MGGGRNVELAGFWWGVDVVGERRSGFDEYIVGTPILNWKLVLECMDGRQGSSRPMNRAKGKAGKNHQCY